MKLQESEIVDGVRQVCAETLRVSEERIQPESRLIEDLEVDSLFIVQLSIALEERFGIEVPEDELPGVQTVRDLCDFVAAKVEAA